MALYATITGRGNTGYAGYFVNAKPDDGTYTYALYAGTPNVVSNGGIAIVTQGMVQANNTPNSICAICGTSQGADVDLGSGSYGVYGYSQLTAGEKATLAGTYGWAEIDGGQVDQDIAGVSGQGEQFGGIVIGMVTGGEFETDNYFFSGGTTSADLAGVKASASAYNYSGAALNNIYGGFIKTDAGTRSHQYVRCLY